MPKLQETKGRYFITIPISLVEMKDWKKGQKIFIVFNERGNMELTDKLKE